MWQTKLSVSSFITQTQVCGQLCGSRWDKERRQSCLDPTHVRFGGFEVRRFNELQHQRRVSVSLQFSASPPAFWQTTVSFIHSLGVIVKLLSLCIFCYSTYKQLRKKKPTYDMTSSSRNMNIFKATVNIASISVSFLSFFLFYLMTGIMCFLFYSLLSLYTVFVRFLIQCI